MVNKHSILKPEQVLPTSTEVKEKLNSLSKKMGNKDLFSKKVELAKQTFQKINILPF